jgi:hypothetical protein
MVRFWSSATQTVEATIVHVRSPPKATVGEQTVIRGFVPIASQCTAAKAPLFDHLVGEREQLCRNFDVECLCCLQVERQFELATKGDDLRGQEPFYFRQCLIRHFFRQPVPGWQGFARDLRSSMAPDREDIIFSAHHSVGTPKRQQRTGDFTIHVGLIVHKVDRCGCAIVLACGVNGGWIAETASIFRIRLRLDGFGHD